MPEEHSYPSAYQKGQHWAFDEAWALLDALRPGVLDATVRCMLAGMIAGTLVRLHGSQAADWRTEAHALRGQLTALGDSERHAQQGQNHLQNPMHEFQNHLRGER